jgi:hypothetical protein
MRRMIHQHLQRSALVAPPMLTDMHLDEDALSAFIEGRLTETESAPVISHLVSCGFCRRITAQLVRLDSETSAAEPHTPASTEEPGRIRRLLQDLAARVLPSADDAGDAVFAYHAPADDFRRKDEAAAASEDATAEETRPENQSDPEPNK